MSDWKTLADQIERQQRATRHEVQAWYDYKWAQVMTPRLYAVFQQHRPMFLERAAQLKREDLGRYITANAEGRRELGRQIRQVRKAIGWRQQAQLAEAADVSTETISRVENGGNVGVTTLGKILDAVTIIKDDPIQFLVDKDEPWLRATLDDLAQKSAGAADFGELKSPTFTLNDRKDVTKVSAPTGAERIESEQPSPTNESGPHGRTPIFSGGDHSGIYVDQLLRALESVERLSAQLTANLNALHDLSDTVIDRSAAVSTASPSELAATTRVLTRSARPASAARRKTGGKTPRRAK
jgi:transcriptional regulator with XRE-family HTH domain